MASAVRSMWCVGREGRSGGVPLYSLKGFGNLSMTCLMEVGRLSYACLSSSILSIDVLILR